MQKVYFKLKSFYLGWYNFLFKPKSFIAQTRLAICDTCEFRKGYFCGECGCVLVAKAESPEEKCPKNKWQEVDKWTQIE